MAGVVLGLHSSAEFKHQGVVPVCLIRQAYAIDAELLGGYGLGHVLAAGDILQQLPHVHNFQPIGQTPT